MLKEKMILINRNETDPYFNIAAEEYVLKEMNEEVFMLWVNDPSVIIGKHQVAAAEANIIFTHKHKIPIIRRISGGGTVATAQLGLSRASPCFVRLGKRISTAFLFKNRPFLPDDVLFRRQCCRPPK